MPRTDDLLQRGSCRSAFRRVPCLRFLAAVACLIGVLSASDGFASIIAWTGSANDGLWSNSANWQGGILPADGDSVSFNANPLGFSDVNYSVTLDTFTFAHNLGNFLRRLALPKPVRNWSLTTLREKLIKIGAKVTRRSKYVTFQLAEGAVTRNLFGAILDRIARLAMPPPIACRMYT